MSGLRVKDEDDKKLMLKEPLIVDVWGADTVKEFYAVYPRIRRNYYDGPLFSRLSSWLEHVLSVEG